MVYSQITATPVATTTPWASIRLYDSFMKVPMVWRWPGGLPGGRTFEGFFEGVDLVPTLLEALSLPIPKPVDGTSLWKQLVGDDGPGKDCVLMEYFDPGIGEVVHAVPKATRYTLSGWSVLTLIDEQNKYWIDGRGQRNPLRPKG